MKKITAIITTILLVGCVKTVPVEKYGGSKYVITDKQLRDFERIVDL